MAGRVLHAFVLAALLILGGCGKKDDGPLGVAVIDSESDLLADGIRLSEGGRLVRGATASGLVALDATGEIEPALADRWIVTEDGKSYIFRLREGTWPDGTELTGESARDALREAMRRLRGTSLGLDLAPVDQVRAMAGRVVEIDLSTPMPDFLRVLAQPELALVHGDSQAGEMVVEPQHKSTDRAGKAIRLTFRAPELRGLPEEPNWQAHVRTIDLRPLGARAALAAFDHGQADVVLGGTAADWPLADPGPLSLGNVRLDNAVGLFGLQVMRARGILARPAEREAIAMAIDRAALLGKFNVGGWTPATRIMPPALLTPAPPERWDGLTIEQRRTVAASRIAAWRSGVGKGQAPVVTVAAADQPGLAILVNELAEQLATIGVTLERVPPEQPADLAIVDRVARFAAPLWFLDQFACSLRRGLCDSEADAAVRAALATEDPQAKADAFARADVVLTAAEIYIPLGAPLRWSMVRSRVDGFAANPWAWHPLPPMATVPK